MYILIFVWGECNKIQTKSKSFDAYLVAPFHRRWPLYFLIIRQHWIWHRENWTFRSSWLMNLSQLVKLEKKFHIFSCDPIITLVRYLVFRFVNFQYAKVYLLLLNSYTNWRMVFFFIFFCIPLPPPSSSSLLQSCIKEIVTSLTLQYAYFYL